MIDEKQYNHPDHYINDKGEECIDKMIEEFGVSAVINFCLCNGFKYRWRAGKKQDNDAELDLKKARWYDDKATVLAEGLFI